MDYLSLNLQSWNDRTAVHLESEFYDVKGFIAGKNPLNSIELDLLGKVNGKSILHLQCHFGMDTLQLARMGASVTGADLSDASIDAAKDLANKTGLAGEFICSDLYNLPANLQGNFDIVFTSYGTVGWLPDINKWAKVVAYFLKPGGIFVMADFHPFIWMYDDDLKAIIYRYFQGDAIVETTTGTYANKEAAIERTDVGWNHGIAEIIQSLLDEGLVLQKMEEYDYSPYNCFKEMVEAEPKKFRFSHLENKIPIAFGLRFGKS